MLAVCLLDINSVRELIDQNPRFGASILKMINEVTVRYYKRMACLTLKQLHGRFADLLLCLSLRIYKRNKFTVPLSRKDMAEIMNMSQESLSRVIKDYKTDKILEIGGSKFNILDFDKIQKLSMVG